MTIRTVKRSVLIREYDFDQIKTRALGLYDRVSWEPLTKNQLEREHFWGVMKNPQAPPADPQWPRDFLHGFRHQLYNADYWRWQCEYDAQGYLWLQYRSHLPRTRIGRACFEKDFVRK